MKRSVRAGGAGLAYTLCRTRRKDVLLKALPGGETRVYAPEWMRLCDIDALVRGEADELRRAHAQLDEATAQNRLQHPVRDGSRLCIEGKPCTLHLRQGRAISLTPDAAGCTLTLPDPKDEEAVRDALRRTLSRRALERISERLKLYAPRLGVHYGRVTIREQKTRWGSCSAKHNLNFNWKLILAPPEVLDYVVLHELCHLIEFNHSPRFWQLLRSYMPEYECWKAWLRCHGAELGI